MLNHTALNTLFIEARTHNVWLNQEVSDSLCEEIYHLAKWGATSANCSPARFVFVKSALEKEKLVSCLDVGNQEKTRAAPVTVIIGMDYTFYENMPYLFPHAPDAKSWFEGRSGVIETTAFRNSSLQGAYLMLAARALGLDCGPMSGFDAHKINAAFFSGTSIQVNFICNMGYGDKTQLFPRSPRLGFKEACRIV